MINILLSSFVVLFIISIVEIITLTFIKKFSITNNTLYFGSALLTYCLLIMLVSYVFKYNQISVTVAVWSGFSVICATLLSIFYFKEKHNFNMLVGIIIIVIGIVILEYNNSYDIHYK